MSQRQNWLLVLLAAVLLAQHVAETHASDANCVKGKHCYNQKTGECDSNCWMALNFAADCVAGTYYEPTLADGLGMCIPCPANTFGPYQVPGIRAPKGHPQPCLPCPQGKTSKAGSTSCN